VILLAVVIDRSAKFKPALKLARQFDRTRRPFDVLFEGKILIKHSGQLRFVSGYRVDPSIQSRPAVRPVRDSHGERGMFRCAASGFHLDLAKGVVRSRDRCEGAATPSQHFVDPTRVSAQRSEAPQSSEAFLRAAQRDTARAPTFGILNPSISILISFAKLAAPAPFTTR
jgi:hypothetical protein